MTPETRKRAEELLHRPGGCGHPASREHLTLMLNMDDKNKQPLILGGQGRTARSVREDGSSIITWLIAAAIVLVLAKILGGA